VLLKANKCVRHMMQVLDAARKAGFGEQCRLGEGLPVMGVIFAGNQRQGTHHAPGIATN
jgi:hypothetical protein